MTIQFCCANFSMLYNFTFFRVFYESEPIRYNILYTKANLLYDMSVLEDKYSAFKTRQSKRRWAYGALFIIFVLLAIFGLYVWIYARWFYNDWIIISAPAFLDGFL